MLGTLLSLVLASGAQAQTLKEKYELSEQHFEKAAGVECIFGRGHGISRSMRLRHQHRNRPPNSPTPTPRPRPEIGLWPRLKLAVEGSCQG